MAYHAIGPGQMQPAHLQLRLRGDPAGLAQRIRDIAATVDPMLHVDEVQTLAEIYRANRFGDNLGAIAIGAVTGSVLLLSAAGLYALMTFTVAQGRREIGIRAALGAQPSHMVAAVFRRAFWQIAAGSAAGVFAAYLTRLYVPIEQIGGLPDPRRAPQCGRIHAARRAPCRARSCATQPPHRSHRSAAKRVRVVRTDRRDWSAPGGEG